MCIQVPRNLDLHMEWRRLRLLCSFARVAVTFHVSMKARMIEC
jgi:hypothetical protein